MKLLLSADIHVKLGQKGIPKEWNKNRFLILAERLDKIFKDYSCDLHVIMGDLTDVSNPSTEELELVFAFLEKLNHKGLIFTGNHELISKTISCLFYLADAIAKATSYKWKVITEPYRSKDFDIVDYVELHKKTWIPAVGRLCLSHVRGSIPPHVQPEIDLNKFAEHGYKLVVAGDLHSYQNTQQINDSLTLLYPGSPLTTSFHRERTKNTNGCLIIDTETLEYEWIELGDLPQLIRKTVTINDELLPDPYDRVIYEVEGDVSELKKLKGSDLLDKKINTKVSKDAKLNLENKTTLEELALYLTDVQGLDKESVECLVSKATIYVRD